MKAARLQPRRTQRERTEETKERLIEAATGALMELGGQGATVAAICRRAAVTSGAIQHHFGSKEGLMTAVVERLFRPFDIGQDESVGASGTLQERIERLVDHYWSIYDDPSYAAVAELLLASRFDATLQQMLTAMRARHYEAQERYVAAQFPEITLSGAERRRVVGLANDLMRGAAIRRLFEQTRGDGAAIRAEAVRMIASRFGAADNQTETQHD